MAKPFLLLCVRAEQEAAVSEYEALLRVTRLTPDRLHWYRLDAQPLQLDLADYAGVFIGGSAFCVSDEHKSPVQLRVEADLDRVLDYALANDFPVLGLCYGLGIIVQHFRGVVDRTYGEELKAVMLRPAGVADPLLSGVSDPFYAFVGHKEGVSVVPDQGVVLGSGEQCPVQLLRMGRRLKWPRSAYRASPPVMHRMTVPRTMKPCMWLAWK